VYKQILLASDGTRGSLVALREGALIAKIFQATAHLLIIEPETAGHRMAQGVAMQILPVQGQELLDLGLGRLRQLGVPATGELIRGEPGQLIIDCARRKQVDLIVLGHRRLSFLERWWSGPSGAYIVDGVACSVLIARDTISDEEFERHLIGGS
jgi:nucleotide-binding universal stress UspA family protein